MNEEPLEKRNTLSKGKRIIFISLGFFFIVLGALGVFLPILPTTPFILISAALFVRSSDKFYRWLLSNRIFGKYIKNYRQGKGIPLRIKVFAITLLWVTISLSAFLAVEIIYVRIILLLIAIGVTVHIISIRPISKK